MPMRSSLRMICGNTLSDEAVPATIISSSRRYRMSLKMLNPAMRRIAPRITTTKMVTVR